MEGSLTFSICKIIYVATQSATVCPELCETGLFLQTLWCDDSIDSRLVSSPELGVGKEGELPNSSMTDIIRPRPKAHIHTYLGVRIRIFWCLSDRIRWREYRSSDQATDHLSMMVQGGGRVFIIGC